MARVLVVANQKGGVGKTTSALNLSASLAAAEQRVLAIDMDPQGNLSSGLGVTPQKFESHIYQLLMKEAAADDVMRTTQMPHLEVIPATTDLVGAEVELVAESDRHDRLRHALIPLQQRFDYIIIDCPPSLGILTLNALVAAERVLIPLQCEYYALEGLGHLLTTIDRVRGALNPQLELEGVLLCMYDRRTNLAAQVVNEVREHMAGKVLDTVIPRNVKLGESPSFGKPVILYDIDSSGARAYLQLAEEVLARHHAESHHGAAEI